MPDLYKYLPEFLRIQDKLYSEGTPGEPGDTPVLQRLVEILAQEFDTNDKLVRSLSELFDPDKINSEYWLHLSYILGRIIGTSVDESFARWLIKNAIYFWKIKGTHLSWKKEWKWLDEVPPIVSELWKSVPSEINDYSFNKDTEHPLASARIELTHCTGVCESACETTCEYSCETDVETGELLDRNEATRLMRLVEDNRPVHVLLRRDAVVTILSSSTPGSSDTLGHFPAESGEIYPWKGSEAHGDFSDHYYRAGDGVEISVSCLTACESNCQGCCETACECDTCEEFCQAGTCQLSCTSVCEFNCEWACENSCQFGCTASGMEGGICLSVCQTACQEVCQTRCQVDCQTACQNVDCQSYFQPFRYVELPGNP